MSKQQSFQTRLKKLISDHIKKYNGEPPDLILINYIQKCLTLFNKTVNLEQNITPNIIVTPKEFFNHIKKCVDNQKNVELNRKLNTIGTMIIEAANSGKTFLSIQSQDLADVSIDRLHNIEDHLRSCGFVVEYNGALIIKWEQ